MMVIIKMNVKKKIEMRRVKWKKKRAAHHHHCEDHGKSHYQWQRPIKSSDTIIQSDKIDKTGVIDKYDTFNRFDELAKGIRTAN
jgi:Ni/Co efflux regulator RcnB